MSTFTTAKNLERVANAADVGTWDAPTNSNWSIVDACLGQSVTIGLNNSNVVLSTPQYQCAQVIFNSTLTASVTITFPSTFTGPYIVQNLCTGTSVNTITLQTTVAGGQVIACPPGDSFHAINDGTNLKFHNFGRVGSYWDYGGSSLPNWVSGCTVAPWLNCDGTQFSSATFPALTVVLGSTTLPDSRGRARYALNQTTSRIQSSVTALDGTVLAAGGGSQFLHGHVHGVTDPGHTHTHNANVNVANLIGTGATLNVPNTGAATINSAVTNISINLTGAGNSQNLPPAYMGGLVMIRSA